MRRLFVLKFIIFIILLTILSSFAADESVVVYSGLNFGTMFPGIPKTIDKSSADAAVFFVDGDNNAEITLDFTLPQYMSTVHKDIMPILFLNDDCAMDRSNNPDQSAPQYDDLDPWVTHTYRIGIQGMYVWLGGKVVPKVRQPAGAYTADIILTVQYTGL